MSGSASSDGDSPAVEFSTTGTPAVPADRLQLTESEKRTLDPNLNKYDSTPTAKQVKVSRNRARTQRSFWQTFTLHPTLFGPNQTPEEERAIEQARSTMHVKMAASTVCGTSVMALIGHQAPPLPRRFGMGLGALCGVLLGYIFAVKPALQHIINELPATSRIRREAVRTILSHNPEWHRVVLKQAEAMGLDPQSDEAIDAAFPDKTQRDEFTAEAQLLSQQPADGLIPWTKEMSKSLTEEEKAHLAAQFEDELDGEAPTDKKRSAAKKQPVAEGIMRNPSLRKFVRSKEDIERLIELDEKRHRKRFEVDFAKNVDPDKLIDSFDRMRTIPSFMVDERKTPATRMKGQPEGGGTATDRWRRETIRQESIRLHAKKLRERQQNK